MSRRPSTAHHDPPEKNERWLTPPAIAKKLGVDSHRVLNWIHSGKLQAIDVSDGARPRYRVSPDALEEYLQTRMVVPNAPRSSRKMPRLPQVKTFF